MFFEVEQKFPVADLGHYETAFSRIGTEFRAPETQVDTYFSHPSRDFAVTDEALRVRSVGDKTIVTYKSPKIDKTTKTRMEHEIPLRDGAGQAADFQQLLICLGFRSLLQVHKTRRQGRLHYGGTDIDVAIDDVRDLGGFVELEMLVTPDGIEAAKEHLARVAAALGLGASERLSYCELMLRRNVT